MFGHRGHRAHGGHRGRRAALAATLVGALALGLAACSHDDSPDGVTTITLEGPNQWTNSGSSFGPAWDRLIDRFQRANPTIRVKTVVLPLTQFNQTISTQLAAATAPELVFNQASFRPYMVHHLESYLTKPNPYVPGNRRWLDLFDPKFYGLKKSTSIDPEGHVDFVPFNLVTAGVFYNRAALRKAGVHPPIATFAGLIEACGKLKTAGYTPFGMDDSEIGVSWSAATIANMMLHGQYDRLNVFDAAGAPGRNPQLTGKDWAKAVLTGQITPRTPEVGEALRLLKAFYDSCVTKNWSGISGLSGAMVNIRDFSAGRAAMTWGTDYAPAALPDVDFDYASMPFPTLTKDSSPLATGAAAQFGISTGGTSYMIPAKTSGAKLKAAVRFLQWMSVGTNLQSWLDGTGAIPAVRAAHAPAVTRGFATGAWGETPTVGGLPVGPPGTTTVSLYDGFLLGSKSLTDEQSYLDGLWHKAEVQAVKDNGWDHEDWAQDGN